MRNEPVINGLVYLWEIEKRRGFVIGRLVTKPEPREVVFESEFPTYSDAYLALKDMDGNEFLAG